MRSVSVRLEDLKTMILNLGFAGENEHTRVTVDCKKLYDQYPNASASLTVQPPEGEAYPAVIERDGDNVIWDVTDSDLIAEGSGELQLSFTQEPHLAKSYIGRFKVGRSIIPTGEVPEPLDDFLTRAGVALTGIPETINSALAEAKASGEFDGPQGPAGQDGADGQDGFSPVVEVSAITGGHRVSVTDAEGTETFDVMDGVDGQDGTDGNDGVTPEISIGTVAKGTDPEASMDNTDPAHPVLSLTLPKGDKGDQGDPAPAELVTTAVNAYLTSVITNPDSPPLDRTLSSNVSAAPADMVGDLKSALDEVVQNTENNLPLSAWESGYIDTSGSAATQSATKYASVSISSDLVGKSIYVSGSAWWSVKPYVFVGTTTIAAPVQGPGGTPTQYSDLVFVPEETGTLYVNVYSSGSVIHTGKAYTIEIESIKSSMLPQPLPVNDVVGYSPVVLTMIQYKKLNGATGEITSDESSIYYVTDYTEVVPNSKIMLTTSNFWGLGLWAFYDANLKFINGQKANSGGTPTTVYCQIVDVPKNAKYIVIGMLYQNNFNNCYLWQGAIASALPSQKWNGKKWVLIGDSLTEHNDKAEMHYYDYIVGATGINIVNLAVSGTGYAKGITTFMAQANSVPSDADVVTLFGSFNDLSSGLDIGTATDTGTNTIAGCINTAFDNIQTIIPCANIGVIAPTPWNTAPPSTSGNAYDYVEMLKTICEKRSIPFLDLWRESNLRPWDLDFLPYAYSNDGGGGIHPNSTGQKLFAPRIKAFLETLLI